MARPNAQPTLQSRLDAGELVHIGNLSTHPIMPHLKVRMDGDGKPKIVPRQEENEQHLAHAIETYGEGEVGIGEAVDYRGTVIPNPRKIGVYVTRTAYDTVHHIKRAESLREIESFGPPIKECRNITIEHGPSRKRSVPVRVNTTSTR